MDREGGTFLICDGQVRVSSLVRRHRLVTSQVVQANFRAALKISSLHIFVSSLFFYSLVLRSIITGLWAGHRFPLPTRRFFPLLRGDPTDPWAHPACHAVGI